MSGTIHIEYPFDQVHAGAGVLAAAMTLFDPTDQVDLVFSATEGMPEATQVDAFRRLRAELCLPYGEPPRMRVVDAGDAAAMPAIARVKATGDAAGDARAVLALGSIGRQLGSAYGAGTTWLRGAPDLARADLDAAFARRQFHRGLPAPTTVRVVVLVQRMQVWGAVDTIVRAGLASSDVELDVVLLPEESSSYRQHSRAEVEAFLAERGAKLRDHDWLRSNLADLDVVVTPDPYITRNNTAPGLSPLEIAESGVRVVLTPYAQALSGDPGNLAMLHNLPFHNLVWRIFAPSTGAVANFDRYCRAGSSHVRHVGSTKREHLLTDEASASAAYQLRRRLRAHRVVLWNPHFVGDGELSTFDRLAAPILNHVAEHRDIGLIVRPHPRLFTELEYAGADAAVAAFRKRVDGLPNAFLDESIDAAAAMLAADAMISDLSSLIAEYQALGRPVGLLRPTPETTPNEDRAWLDGSVTIDGPADLNRFLQRVRPAGAPSAEGASDLGAGTRVIETIVRELRQERAALR